MNNDYLIIGILFCIFEKLETNRALKTIATVFAFLYFAAHISKAWNSL